MSLHFIEIPNHPTYLINRAGEVYNTKSNRKIKPSLTSSSGYYTVYVDGIFLEIEEKTHYEISFEYIYR